MDRSLRSNPLKLRTHLPQRMRRFVPALEQLECRILPSTLIQLDSSGSGFSAGTLINPATPAEFDFQATVSGRISVLMHAGRQGMQSLLTPASGTSFADQTFVPSQLVEARDDLVQFTNVTAGEVFHLDAGVFYDPTKPYLPVVVGSYSLYISTETTDFSATTPHVISLDSSGQGIQLGTIETPGDADLFAFTASVTGRAFVRVDGGAISSQVLSIDTIPGQTYGFLVSDAGNHTGPYVITVDSIADDFTDGKLYEINLSNTSTLSGGVNYPGDVDTFGFTATQSGVMTLKMQNQGAANDISTLQCALSVSGAALTYSISPSRPSTDDAPANDSIVQFDVVKGRHYTFTASGANGSIGSFLLSLSMAVDDDSATTPHLISLDPSGAGAQTGSIEVPGDKALFQFAATADGYVVVSLIPTGSSRVGTPPNRYWEPGTNMQGLLTFVAAPVVAGIIFNNSTTASFGPLVVFSGAGWREATRDEFAVIEVTKGNTYQFFVSAADNTLGDYTLALATYTAGATATFTTTGLDHLGVGSVQTLTFAFSTGLNSLQIEVGPVVSPLHEISGPTTSPTNIRLAAFTLPSLNIITQPSTVTIPSGQSTSASNSLIAALLIVAARDNSVQSRDNVVAAGLGRSDAASTLLTSLLIGLVAPGPGSNDPTTALLIRGTVFDDLDGDGLQADKELGVAGETVLLEVQKGGQYVVVNSATTDTNGAYVFTDVKPGDYRVRLVNQAGPGSDRTTPTSHTVKVISDSKPRIINFGTASKHGTTRTDRGQPSNYWVVEDVVAPQENALFEEVDRVFRDWDEVGGAAPFLDDVERDGSASDCWFGLLAPIALLGIASIQWDLPAIDRGPGTSRRQRT
jgi:SdrD B-like domain